MMMPTPTNFISYFETGFWGFGKLMEYRQNIVVIEGWEK